MRTCGARRRIRPEHFLHRRPAAHHAGEFETLRDLAIQFHHPRAALRLLAHDRERALQPFQIEWLGQVVGSPELHRFDRRIDRGETGHQYDGRSGVRLAQLSDDLESADVRHPEIDHHQIRPPLFGQRQRLTTTRADEHLEPLALGEPLGQRQDAGLVVDDQYERAAVVAHQ